MGAVFHSYLTGNISRGCWKRAVIVPGSIYCITAVVLLLPLLRSISIYCAVSVLSECGHSLPLKSSWAARWASSQPSDMKYHVFADVIERQYHLVDPAGGNLRLVGGVDEEAGGGGGVHRELNFSFLYRISCFFFFVKWTSSDERPLKLWLKKFYSISCTKALLLVWADRIFHPPQIYFFLPICHPREKQERLQRSHPSKW